MKEVLGKTTHNTIKYCLFLVLMVVKPLNYGQSWSYNGIRLNNPYSQELIFLHTDRVSYVVNEKIWFKAFIFNGLEVGGESKVLNVKLIDDKGVIINKGKYRISNSMTDGYMQIPENVNMGSYTLIAYTNQLKNLEQNISVKKSIKVLNPNQGLTPLYSNANEILISQLPIKELAFEVSINNKQYSVRDKVSLKINNSSKNSLSNFSISIAKKNNYNNLPIDTLLIDSSILKDVKRSSVYENGIVISGSLMTYDLKKPLPDKLIFISMLGEGAIVKHVRTNESGAFKFVFDDIYERKNFVISTKEFNTSYKILLNLNDDIVLTPINHSIVVENDDVSYYEDLIKNKSISSEYIEYYNIPPIIQTEEHQTFYGKPDSIYRIEKYVELTSIRDVLYELVDNIIVKRKRGESTIKVYPNNSSFPLQNPPLVLIDGVPYFNDKELLEAASNLFDKIEVVNSDYLLGDVVFGGIISFFTKDKKFANLKMDPSAKFFSYSMYSKPGVFHSMNYDNKRSYSSKIPDFRTTLYWKPSIQIPPRGEVEIAFFTSDDVGQYEITVVGKSKMRELGVKKLLFNVVNSD